MSLGPRQIPRRRREKLPHAACARHRLPLSFRHEFCRNERRRRGGRGMQDGAPRRPDAAQPRDLRPTRFGVPTPPRPRRNGKNKKDSGARSLRGCSNHSDYRRHRSRCPEKRDIIESIEQSRVPETSDQSEATTLHWSVRLHFLLSPRLYISRKQAQKFRSPVILNPKKKKNLTHQTPSPPPSTIHPQQRPPRLSLTYVIKSLQPVCQYRLLLWHSTTRSVPHFDRLP